MPKSPHAAYLDGVISELRPDFKELGYRKRGTTFNRACNDLVHVVNFQMDRWNPHRSEPGFDPAHPGGRFTVNLGVYLPEVDVAEKGWAEEKWAAEMVCHVRERLGVLATGRDHWWTMTGPQARLADDVRRRLQDHGFPWLARFESVDQVLRDWRDLRSWSPGAHQWWLTRGALVQALRGDPEAARPVIEAALRDMDRPQRAYLCSKAERVGIVGLKGCS